MVCLPGLPPTFLCLWAGPNTGGENSCEMAGQGGFSLRNIFWVSVTMPCRVELGENIIRLNLENLRYYQAAFIMAMCLSVLGSPSTLLLGTAGTVTEYWKSCWPVKSRKERTV